MTRRLTTTPLAQNQHSYNFVIDSLTLGAEATDTAEAEEQLAADEVATEDPWWLKAERGEYFKDKDGNLERDSFGNLIPITTTKYKKDADGYLLRDEHGNLVLETSHAPVAGGSQDKTMMTRYTARPSTYTAEGTDPLSKQLRLKGFARKGRQNFSPDRMSRFYKIRGGDHASTERLYTYPANTAKYDTLIVDLPAWFCQAQNSGKSVEIELVQVFHREYKTRKEPETKAVTNPDTGETVSEPVTDDEGNPVYIEVPLPDEEQDPYKTLECTCHSDLVQVNTSADYCLGATNVMYSFPKKYIIGNSVQYFNMWFRDMSGKIVDIDPFKTHLIVELILRW